MQLKVLEKQEKANPKISKREEIIKIRAEMETKDQCKGSKKQKVGSLKG
jgi:hypothetical protein